MTIEKDINDIQIFNEGRQIGIELGRQQVISELIKLYTEKEKAFAKELENRYQTEIIQKIWEN